MQTNQSNREDPSRLTAREALVASAQGAVQSKSARLLAVKAEELRLEELLRPTASKQSALRTEKIALDCEITQLERIIDRKGEFLFKKPEMTVEEARTRLSVCRARLVAIAAEQSQLEEQAKPYTEPLSKL